jgi:hypothetical protein
VLFQNLGIWALDSDGKVAQATKRFNSASSFTAPRGNTNSVGLIAHDHSELAAFTPNLRLIKKSSLSHVAGPWEIDPDDAEWPIVGINFSRDDLLLQRMNLDGGLSWTLTAALDAGEVGGAAVYLANLRVPESKRIEKVIVTLLSDGRVLIAASSGEPIYRGRFSTDKILDRDGKSWVAYGLAVADLDKDGEDELYTAIDSQLVRLRTIK